MKFSEWWPGELRCHQTRTEAGGPKGNGRDFSHLLYAVDDRESPSLSFLTAKSFFFIRRRIGLARAIEPQHFVTRCRGAFHGQSIVEVLP